jgi:hypothetical protein
MGRAKASTETTAEAAAAPIYNPHTGEQDEQKNDDDVLPGDDHSMSSGTSGTKTSDNNNNKNSKSKIMPFYQEGIAASLLVGLRETRWVNNSKFCLLLVLTTCAIACAVTTYIFVTDNETVGFEQQVRT